jgi:hypothetical protein
VEAEDLGRGGALGGVPGVAKVFGHQAGIVDRIEQEGSDVVRVGLDDVLHFGGQGREHGDAVVRVRDQS